MNNNFVRKFFLTMDVTNSIFNGTNKTESVYRSKISALDTGQMTKNEERYFNTYRYWLPFYAPMEGTIEGEEGEGGEPKIGDYTAKHTKSLFNNTSGLVTYDDFRVDANSPLLDNPESRKNQRKNMACTIKDLVDATAKGELGRQTYSYADFAYCKHLGKLPNNYLITLRRFGTPAGNKIDKRHIKGIDSYEDLIQAHLADQGHLVTWLGTPGNEINSVLKYSYKMNWADQKAEIDEVSSDGEGQGPLASIFNMANSNYRKEVMQGRRGTNFAGKSFMNTMLGGGDNFNPPYPHSTFDAMYDKNKIYGPIDVIQQTKRRDRGLEMDFKIELTFDYELRSYYGINGRAAMLDLLANILAVTYNHGNFWGGAHRFVGGAQDNIFANLPIFKLADKGGLNNPGAVVDALIDSIHQGAAAFTNGVQGDTPREKIMNMAKDLGGMLLGGLLNKLGRPQKLAVSSLVSGAPTGCWHLTIGNPKSPIIEIGNLCCTNAAIEHYGPLGLDDFPTGLRVKISLEPGKPLDLSGIEKMYGRGDTRIYSPMGDKIIDMYKKSKKISTYKDSKKQDTATKTKQTTNSQESMYAPVITEEINTTNEIIPDNKDAIDSVKRWFGTDDEFRITTVGSEAFMGSEPPKKEGSGS